MFMVEANEAVARLLAERQVPCLRRIHDEPDDLAMRSLRKFLGALGCDLPTRYDRGALQALLKRVSGKGEEYAVNLAVLRSMQRAEYSPLRIGHYALASENYCHFTSPIRRYPDLTMHRLVDDYLRGAFDDKRGLDQVPSEDEQISLGNHCSANERRAEAAERELRLVLVLRLLERHLGERFDGIVTGVSNVGLFVQLDHFLVDGLLRFSALADDWWEVDPSHGVVIGERSGHRIKIGDRLKVVVGYIHIPNRQLELGLAEPMKAAGSSLRAGHKRSARHPVRRKPSTKTTPATPRGRRGRNVKRRMTGPGSRTRRKR
jgi:ribonuclease R